MRFEVVVPVVEVDRVNGAFGDTQPEPARAPKPGPRNPIPAGGLR